MVGQILFGGVDDRPWGLTVAAMWLGELTGRVVVRARDDELAVVFERGNVVAATSSCACDSVVAIGAAAGIIPRAHVDALRRQLAATRDADEIDVAASYLGMPQYAALRFRRLVVAHRAARTFMLEGGEFVIDDRPERGECLVDTRAVVYRGARYMLSERQLIAQLVAIGTQFAVADRSALDTAQFGFAEPLPAELLERGCSIVELTDHVKRAMVYALACCGVLAPTERAARPRAATAPPTVPRTRTLRDIVS